MRLPACVAPIVQRMPTAPRVPNHEDRKRPRRPLPLHRQSEQGQEPLETSEGREPLAILFGHGNIIPGLEKAMEGREAGDKFDVDVAAADAYGEQREGLTQRVPKKHFEGAAPGAGHAGRAARPTSARAR